MHHLPRAKTNLRGRGGGVERMTGSAWRGEHVTVFHALIDNRVCCGDEQARIGSARTNVTMPAWLDQKMRRTEMAADEAGGVWEERYFASE